MIRVWDKTVKVWYIDKSEGAGVKMKCLLFVLMTSLVCGNAIAGVDGNWNGWANLGKSDGTTATNGYCSHMNALITRTINALRIKTSHNCNARKTDVTLKVRGGELFLKDVKIGNLTKDTFLADTQPLGEDDRFIWVGVIEQLSEMRFTDFRFNLSGNFVSQVDGYFSKTS